MRVLLVAEQLRRRVPGGIGTYVRGLAAGLSAMGPEAPDVVLHASRAPAAPDPLAALGVPRLVSPLPSPLLTRAWDHDLLRPPADYDTVHATSFAYPRPRGGRLSVMVHDLAWRQVPEAYPARGRRWHERRLAATLAAGDLFLTASTCVADQLVAEGAKAAAVEVVEHGSDHLPPPDTDGAARRLSEAGVDGPYLLSVSTLEPRKNLSRLLEAYARMRGRLPEPWPLVVVGPHGWGPTVAPVPGAVLVGPAGYAELAALYCGCRALVFVPLVEGFGLPAVEAMRMGAPVVASPMPSTAGAALEVDPLDVGAIADAIAVAAVDGPERDALVAAGRRRAAALTWEATARRHVEIWRALA